jgi:hypothetical protein
LSLERYDQQKLLLLLVPNASRESLALVLQKSDALVVSILARGEDGPTSGFTYWDFEELFKADRSEVWDIPLDQVGQGDLAPVENPTMPYSPTLETTVPVPPHNRTIFLSLSALIR